MIVFDDLVRTVVILTEDDRRMERTVVAVSRVVDRTALRYIRFAANLKPQLTYPVTLNGEEV